MTSATRTGYLMKRHSENYLRAATLATSTATAADSAGEISSESVCKGKHLADFAHETERKWRTTSKGNVMFAGLGRRLDGQKFDDKLAEKAGVQLLVGLETFAKVRCHETNLSREQIDRESGTRKDWKDQTDERRRPDDDDDKWPNSRSTSASCSAISTDLLNLSREKHGERHSTTMNQKLEPVLCLNSKQPSAANEQLVQERLENSSKLFLELTMPFHTKMPTKFLLGLLLALLSLSQLRPEHASHRRLLVEATLHRTMPAAAATLPGVQNLDLLKLAPPALGMLSQQQNQQRHLKLDNDSSRVAPKGTPSAAALIDASGPNFEPIKMASSSKFVRTNELDVYLDDMNHNELRTVAAGEPIRDLFRPKPINQIETSPVRQSGSTNHNQRLPAKESESGGDGLAGSHSEQQVYSECALILQRTYVKNIDDSKHRLVPFGKTEQACISYKHIDKAVEQAKHKLKFREFAKMRKNPLAGGPRGPPLAPLDVIHSTLEPPEDLVAAIGEINMATTQIIADQFDLSSDELLNGLPLIDMSKTKFWPLCPLLVRQDLKCRLNRFRSFTAHCNNMKHPTWGAAMTPYARYLPPVHPDGIWVPRKSVVSESLAGPFELAGEAPGEMHANIPRPVFDVGHNEMDESRHRADYHSARAHSQPIIDQLSVVHHRLGGAARPDNELAVDSSVHFVRRTKLEQPLEAAHQHSRPPTPRAIFDGPAGSGSGHSVALAAAATHYRQSHLPAVAVHVQQQQQQAAASSLQLHRSHQHGQHHSALLELPSARLVSSVVHRDVDQPNHDFSLAFVAWGQVINHDMTRAAQPPPTIKCCPQANGTALAGGPRHKLCLPIEVPRDDPFYSKFGVQCLEFRRSLAGVRPNCVLGPRVHQNAITHPVDASFVYGSSQAQADALRLFKGGRLRDRDWFHREGLKPLLPAQEIEPDLECIARPRDLFCFLAGDVRANEQTHLTVLHTLYMREHNRLADKLAELNPHWDDERTFQEARHIVAAGIQHVLINEYIPLLIGRKMAELYNLTAQPVHQATPLAARQAYWRGYDPSVTTSVSNSFAAAAFRQGHSFVQGTIERFNKFHEFVASEKLRFLFKQPFLLYQPGVIDELTLGMLDQPSQSHDPFMSEDVSGHLFQPPELQFGHDLAAINIQRGRDQGLPGYNLWREWCGLPRAETFEQLEPYLTNHTAFHYSRLFRHVDDIDLWSGGVSERRLPGAAIGPTFACIIARQFSNTRRGDRFWYENPGLPSSFTPDQLGELRKVSLAKLLCANSDDLPTIQRWALRMAHPVLNPRVDCHHLPDMDLQFWQEE